MNNTFSQHMQVYKEQIELGSIQQAYKGLLHYIMDLRTHFIHHYQTEFIVGSLYQGYMDITYFPLTPASLKKQQLKIGIVFNHEKIRFEIWLLGRNKQNQKKYWELFKGSDWKKYPISSTPQHSVIEHILVENPDFSQLDSLTDSIENGTVEFIQEIAGILES